MELDRYQAEAMRFAKYPGHLAVTYPAVGLAGEIGEVANKIKKVYRDHHGEPPREVCQDIASEIGDCLWYCAALATDLGITMKLKFYPLRPKKALDPLDCVLKLTVVVGDISHAVHRKRHFPLSDIKRTVEEHLYQFVSLLSMLAYHLFFEIGEIAQMNIDKLLARLDRGTLHGSGDTR